MARSPSYQSYSRCNNADTSWNNHQNDHLNQSLNRTSVDYIQITLIQQTNQTKYINTFCEI